LSESGVEFAGVSFALGGRSLLRDISLRLEPGTVTALLGRSGSGKTTLLRMVNGLVMPTGGSVKVAGKATGVWNQRDLRRRIGYVIQETGLFPHMTVGQNVWLPLVVNSLLAGHHDEGQEMVEWVLASVGLPYVDYGDRYPWQLSGGQRQRVGLARALVNHPKVLLMDEPFGALDPMTRAEMQTMVRDLLGRVRKTVLLVTHDLDEAIYLAQRIVFLDAGAVVADMKSEDVFRSENEYVRRYVAAVNPRLRGETWGTQTGGES
jgi:osmoprotectant transport system ATP-binding protein